MQTVSGLSILIHGVISLPDVIPCDKWRILGECLLISNLPGKALRMLVESRG